MRKRTKTRLNKLANSIQKEKIVYVSQMGSSVHAQGPYKHLTPGNPGFKKRCKFSVFQPLLQQAVSSKAPLAGGEMKASASTAKGTRRWAPPSCPLHSLLRHVSSLLWERASVPPSLYTTVLTDGSDKLSWPVMSVGGYCCRGEEKRGGRRKGDTEQHVTS